MNALRCRLLAFALPLLPCLGSPAAAADPLSEVRGGVLAHDVRFAGGVEPGPDINAELRFHSPFDPDPADPLLLRQLLQPRPALGVEANAAGATSQLYFIGVWTLPLGPHNPALGGARCFFDLGLGGALNNGKQETDDGRRKNLGSHVLFHVSGEIGLRLTAHADLAVYFDHSSNAGLDRINDAINDFGLRFGWRF